MDNIISNLNSLQLELQMATSSPNNPKALGGPTATATHQPTNSPNCTVWQQCTHLECQYWFTHKQQMLCLLYTSPSPRDSTSS
eukprot:3715065-Prorocentrum_lima.AAC.1